MSQSESSVCRVVQPGQTFKGKQELLYNVGVSAESVGAHGIHMQIVTIPPGARAKAHKHQAHETAIYALRGESQVWHGEKLEHHSVVKPGDFFYIPANVPQSYRFELPNVNHVFLPGHRIMVQIQSTLFPLYDRNPQTFVANIFDAKPADYRPATVTILRTEAQPSLIWLPTLPDACD